MLGDTSYTKILRCCDTAMDWHPIQEGAGGE